MTLASVLIANRGEIACRIIQSVQAQGLRAIAVYSEADAQARHVSLADEAVPIGPAPVADSYLSIDKVLDAAKRSGADAIHPGYGFLSENAAFARAVDAAGLVFIGPPAKAISAMGNKADAKRLMIAKGVPCLPGYEGADQSDEVLSRHATEIGFPVMVKAAAGGGGRGMRLVHSAAEIAEAIRLARSEAENAFGSGTLILEKAVLQPRHVEIQIFADNHGTVIHLGERDCSVQRRHQKVIEEAPCPVMTPQLRAQMGQAAVEAARAVDYRGAGTVEFLLDADGAFYFLEMNTRLQVEHPVTEQVTGLDLVALQLCVANGEPLPLAQEDVTLTGHAIEVRLYAEDPANNYLPATGPIDLWHPAEDPGIRIDHGVQPGQEVSPYYDAMLAKIIAHGDTRDIARTRLIKAVERSALLGLKTNSAFLADVLNQPDFIAGQATTALLEQAYPDGFQDAPLSPEEIALAAALLARAEQETAFAASAYVSRDQLGWSPAPIQPCELRLSDGDRPITTTVTCIGDTWHIGLNDDTAPYPVRVLAQDGPQLRARVAEQTFDLICHQEGDRIAFALGAHRRTLWRLRPGLQDTDTASSGRITAPMPGLVMTLAVTEGQNVTKGATLAVLEAMKMQHQIVAPFGGRVTAVHISQNQQVTAGDALLELEDEDS